MKSFYLTALACIITNVLLAQFVRPIPKNKFFTQKNVTAAADIKATFLYKDADKSVYALPTDNMRCLVPDTKTIAAMPNAANNVTVNSMPNIYPLQKKLIPPTP